MDAGWTLEAGSSRGVFIFCDIFIICHYEASKDLRFSAESLSYYLQIQRLNFLLFDAWRKINY
jgi:hypothetical protein